MQDSDTTLSRSLLMFFSVLGSVKVEFPLAFLHVVYRELPVH